jgi:Peptide N-acetyl-beta-D-glucosaminyl asparaginase amidase A
VTISQLSKSAATLVSLSVLLITLASAETLKIGSTNTVTADPPVPHPNTTPCKVTLYEGFIFNDFNPRSFTYTPPAGCVGAWAKVILQADFSITAGIQYDRTANIWIGPTNIYFGTTAEDAPHVARNWHIERDLTDYSSIFTTTQQGTVDLGNEVNSTYAGVIHGSATLFFYPSEPGQPPPTTTVPATTVIAFSSGPTGGTVGLNDGTDLLEQTLTLPTNILLAYLDVYAQSQSNDEFWYTCVPNDVAGELYSCSNTAFRESEVTIDGTPAGVAPVYPWIYTGGIDPFLWAPIPGVQTLNFQPYRVNLTPFVSLLNDGNPHTIALSVFNANGYFSATASLLLYQDPQATQITGGVLKNTLAAPVPTVKEDINVAANGNIHGTVTTRSSHNFEISGYVILPQGPVTTTVAQDINFSNLQSFKILPALYVQDIDQNTTIHSVVTTQNAGGKFTNTVNYNWPLEVDISVAYNSDGSGTQTTSINQYYEEDQEGKHKGQPTSFSLLEDRVRTIDALDFSAAGYITGNANQSSSQNYFSSNSTGYCYSLDLTAAASVLTSVTSGNGCN